MRQELVNSIRKDCEKSLSGQVEALTALKDQSLLVTGGTGFVGKWIAETVSLLNTKYNFNIKLHLLARNTQDFREYVPHLAQQPFIHLIENDVRNVTDLPEDVRWVIHAAGSPDSRKHSSKPLKTIDTIYRGTHAMLDACLRLPDLRKFVHISSNYVYGHQPEGVTAIKEDQVGTYDPNTVNAVYGEAKRLAETVCAIFRNQQLPVTIVRPFAFIGPYQELDKPWAINNFIRDSILGGPIRILGNDQTVRSYLYASDLAVSLLKILVAGKSGSIYNLGGNQAISLKELAGRITRNFGHQIEVLTRSSRVFSSSPVFSVPDLTRLVAEVDVKAVFDLDMAIKKTIDWYRQTAVQESKTRGDS